MKDRMKIPTISRDELKRKIDDGDDFVLLEALPREAFDRGHLPNAHHFPREAAEERASELLPNKETPGVVYCSGPECDSSLKAARALREMGYENVRRYEGGKAEWKRAGYPMVEPAAATAATAAATPTA